VKAKQLLADAGYPNGFTIKADLTAPKQAEALVVQANFRDVGVNLELNVLEQAVWLDHYYGVQTRAPVFLVANLNNFPAMDADFPLQYLKTDSPHKVYSNPEYDRIYAASTTELDPQKRLALLRQLSGILYDDAEAIILIEQQEVWATSKQVQGFGPRPDSQPAYENIVLTN
jgi:peptide/nickel transport system substrate-binding protein